MSFKGYFLAGSLGLITHASSAQETPNLLRVMCEEVDAWGISQDKIIVVSQLSTELGSGSEILDRGRGKSTLREGFSLSWFEGTLPKERSSLELLDHFFASGTPVGKAILGRGRVMRSTLIFTHTEEDQIKFVIDLKKLDTGRYHLNSVTRTNKFICREAFVVPVE